MVLSDFWHSVSVAKKPLSEERFAFVMDGDHEKLCECPDLRKHVGLGECDCCDYCRPCPDSEIVFLVEETRLTTRKKNYQFEFARMRLGLDDKALLSDEDKEAALKDKKGEKYAENRVTWKNRLKAYGGMLVLCRYAAQCAKFAALAGGKMKFHFLLVDSDTVDEEDETDLEYWSGKLRMNLRNLLSPELIGSVEVVRPDDLVRKLPSDCALPRP